MSTCIHNFTIQFHFGTTYPPLCVTVLLWYHLNFTYTHPSHVIVSYLVFVYMRISSWLLLHMYAELLKQTNKKL